jgi:YidC/Oxa1 family membrane protein insertase
MFALANKSYRAIKKMKNLQPQIENLKMLYQNDKTRLNQEIMSLYTKERVNPVSGCLPLAIQPTT